jgi:predicted amidophosphoribosyltransferase
MRCKKCGFENASGQMTCQECGEPLQQGGGYSSAPYYGRQQPYQNVDAKQTRVFSGVPNGAGQQNYSSAQIHPTVIQGSSPSQFSSFKCPDCNYELKEDYDYCPSCGKVLRERAKNEEVSGERYEVRLEPNTCEACGKQVPAEYLHCPYCGTRITQKTIPVKRRRQVVEEVKPRCTLTMITDENESVEALKHDFEGNQIILNRSNTDPLNRTITSKEQARLSFEEGHWYIENLSELDSTFVAASRKIELLSGDIVMMGDRCFSFAPQDNNNKEEEKQTNK